jgi:hypothetical protein
VDKSNQEKIILDLCGGTGSWSRPYKDAGYDVRLVTLPDQDVRTYIPPDNVYGILAAPPCTEFSLAKGNLLRDFEQAMVVVKACLEIIWTCRIKSELAFWCLENPRGFLRQFLGKPPSTVWYWQFGDSLGKPTDLWGYYNPPRPIYTEPPALLDEWDKIKGLKSVQNMSHSEVRAKTPPGFARAFFEANQ